MTQQLKEFLKYSNSEKIINIIKVSGTELLEVYMIKL